MFGLGPTELIVILIVALLVLGPKRLPDLATGLGKAIRKFRSATRDLQDQIEIDDSVRQPMQELRAALRDEPSPIRVTPSPAPSVVPAVGSDAGKEPAAVAKVAEEPAVAGGAPKPPSETATKVN